MSATCFSISTWPEHSISEVENHKAVINPPEVPHPVASFESSKQPSTECSTDALAFDNIFSTFGVPDHIYSLPGVPDHTTTPTEVQLLPISNYMQASYAQFPIQPGPPILYGQHTLVASHPHPSPHSGELYQSQYMSLSSLTLSPPAHWKRSLFSHGVRPRPSPYIVWGELSPGSITSLPCQTVDPSYQQPYTNRDSKKAGLIAMDFPRKRGAVQVSSSCTPVMPSSVQTPVLDEPEVSIPGNGIMWHH